MKLIIDIPEDYYEIIKHHVDNHQLDYRPFEIIANGTPLDDVKAEIKEARLFHVGTFEDDNPIDYGIVEGFNKAITILDNTGKAESEDK